MHAYVQCMHYIQQGAACELCLCLVLCVHGSMVDMVHTYVHAVLLVGPNRLLSIRFCRKGRTSGYCVCVCVCVCGCVWVCVGVGVGVCVGVHVRMSICGCLRMWVYMYVRMSVWVCMYI